MNTDTKLFLDFVANVGIPGGILFVIVLALVRLLPAHLRSLAARDEQARAVASCIPRMRESLEKMAEGNGLLLQLLQQMNMKLDTIHSLVKKVN